MARVRNAACVVVGQDRGAALQRLRGELAEARALLEKMEKEGLGERFDAAAPANEVFFFFETDKPCTDSASKVPSKTQWGRRF